MLLIKMALTRYENCDIFIGQNDVEVLGFSADKTLGEMLDLAMHHKCPVIVKNGKGKWYLKCNGRSITEIEHSIRQNKPSPRRTLYLVTL